MSLLAGGHSFRTAGRALSIAPGLAYMLATGVPADASGGAEPAVPAAAVTASPQCLVNPRAVQPPVDPGVLAWVRGRAERDLTRPT